MMAFLIARHFGRPVLGCLFQREQLARYDQWMQSHRHLSRWLAIAIFFPVAPDDLLCYLAGTTPLSTPPGGRSPPAPRPPGAAPPDCAIDG